MEPLVLVEADNFGGPLVFVAVSAGHPGHSSGFVNVLRDVLLLKLGEAVAGDIAEFAAVAPAPTALEIPPFFKDSFDLVPDSMQRPVGSPRQPTGPRQYRQSYLGLGCSQ